MWQAFIESPGRVSLCGPRRPGSPEPAPYHACRPRDRAPEPARRSEAERASCSAGPCSEHLACLISRRRTYPASTSQNAPKSGHRRQGRAAGCRGRASEGTRTCMHAIDCKQTGGGMSWSDGRFCLAGGSGARGHAECAGGSRPWQFHSVPNQSRSGVAGRHEAAARQRALGRAGAPAGVRSRGSVRCMGARAMGGEQVGEPSKQPAPGGSLMHAWCAHSRPRRARTQAQVAPRPHPPSRARRDAPPARRHRPPGREPHPPRTPCMAAVQDESSRRIVTAHARHACRPHVQQQTYTHPRAPGCHRGMPRGAL